MSQSCDVGLSCGNVSTRRKCVSRVTSGSVAATFPRMWMRTDLRQSGCDGDESRPHKLLCVPTSSEAGDSSDSSSSSMHWMCSVPLVPRDLCCELPSGLLPRLPLPAVTPDLETSSD